MQRAHRIGLLLIAIAGASASLPAAAHATVFGLSAKTDAPSACYAPQRSVTASTSCQLFLGAALRIVATASRDDGSVRLMPQPMTLLALLPGQAPAPVARWVYFDGNDADDDPVVTPTQSTDYQLRFEGNADIPPATSSPMVVGVGVRIGIPAPPRTGRASVRVPVDATLASAAQRGRLELRRCRQTRLFSARSCAARSSYAVVARLSVSRSGQRTFTVRMPARTQRRYEIAFRPASRNFAVTRQAFQVTRGFDGVTRYRYTSRRDVFGTR